MLKIATHIQNISQCYERSIVYLSNLLCVCRSRNIFINALKMSYSMNNIMNNNSAENFWPLSVESYISFWKLILNYFIFRTGQNELWVMLKLGKYPDTSPPPLSLSLQQVASNTIQTLTTRGDFTWHRFLAVRWKFTSERFEVCPSL